MFRTTCVILAIALFGCSDGDSDTDVGGGPKDSGPDITSTPEGGAPMCGPNIYPCPPYGVQSGDVAANLEFVGYSDPKEHCTDHKDKVMDIDNARKISFREFHQPEAGCDSKKRDLLWVMVSAGWCGPCRTEVQQTQTEYAKGSVDSRVGIVNVVFETDKLGVPITDAFLKKWITSFNLTLPAVMDPSFKMGAYFDKKATPFNMLVETKTMKILYRQTGGDLSNIGKKISEYFN
jgi:thiol-disulfide isomerase/thioredoxin